MSNATELLRQALDYIDRNYIIGMQLHQKIHAYLAAEQEVEPVGWTNQDELNTLGTDVTCYMYSEPMVGENNIPLYTISKPTSKPMTEEKIIIEFNSAKKQWFSKVKAFEAGVRFAEKHHKIGDEE